MISDTINKKITEAMKAGDKVRVSTLRMLSSALHNEEIAKREGLDEENELKIVQKEVKKRKDAIEAYKKAGAKEKAELEEKELEVLKDFLPEQLSNEELEKEVELAIKETGANSATQMGEVIGKVKAKVGGRAEGSKIAELVKEKLT